MATLNTVHLERCIATLDRSFELLQETNPDSFDIYVFRSACIKDFELVVEISGKLLRKKLKPYFADEGIADKLFYKDVIRNAVNIGLISYDLGERWIKYRDLRNSVTHEYREEYVEDVLEIILEFISDSLIIVETLKNIEDAD